MICRSNENISLIPPESGTLQAIILNGKRFDIIDGEIIESANPTEVTGVTFVRTEGQSAIVRVTEPHGELREMPIMPMTSFVLRLQFDGEDFSPREVAQELTTLRNEVSQLREELKLTQGVAANRNIAIADIAQENERLKDQIAQQSEDIKSWRAKFFEMEARAIAAVHLVPEDKVCGELRALRDRAKQVLEAAGVSVCS